MTEQIKKPRQSFGSWLLVFFVLFGFWVIFSGMLDVFHISLGAICAALVAYFSGDLMLRDPEGQNRLIKSWRFALYLPWLIYQVVIANVHVAKLVLNPEKIHPQVIRFKTKLKSDFSMVTLANSITLTPGTITMDIIDGEFIVHALSEKVAVDLLSGDMENRVAHIFFEDE
ncbi:MAG: Na+/H+ antiporter subunit E [Proteobacteria bacterium]|nr:Na+/H+ antiporter subunit E [Pseudomonadota bacterium]